MLIVFHGTDGNAARAKMRVLINDLVTKRPDASLLRFDAESFSPDRIPELVHGQGLFSLKYLVVLDHVCEEAENKAEVLAVVPEFAASENVIIVLEGKLDAASKKAFTQHAQKILACDIAGGAAKPAPPATFAVADALGARDKKQLWLRYRQVIDAGTPPEEIHGILFWQIKSMLLAQATDSAKEANMKDYPYQKAKRYAKAYSHDELVRMANELVELYHRSRQGKGELEGLLEGWVVRG